MVEKAVVLAKDFKLPTKPGRYCRLVCMTGTNKGMVYYLHAARIVLGRGDKADIQVHDTKCSREHAELTKLADSYVVTDLGSHNGIVVNDLKVTQHQLKNNDKLIIGQTVYKFGQVHVESEEEKLAKLSDQKNASDEEDDEEQEEQSFSGSAQKAKPKGNTLRLAIIGAVVVLGALFLFDDSDTKPKSESKKATRITDTDDSFSKHLRQNEMEKDKELEDKLSAIIHRGRRELREGNYYRAMNEFNMALVLSPKHGQASFYLQKAKQNLDEEIESHFLKAAREVSALKYSQAAVSYCSVVRLLGKNINDTRLQDAQNRIAELEEKMGLVKGEIKCIEEQSAASGN